MEQNIPREANDISITIQHNYPLDAKLSNLIKASQGRINPLTLLQTTTLLSSSI